MTRNHENLWSVRQVSYRPNGSARAIVSDVSLEIARGRFSALLGPNGAGKTTFIRLLLGTIEPTSGTITFQGRPLADSTRADLARAIGVVPQGEGEPSFTVREIVAMGRYPHLGPWQRERVEDVAAIERAMYRCDVAQFADRWVTTLSGGEQQRVRLARALAQEPSALVLDEPTSSLDIKHEMTTFEFLARLRDEGVTVLIATHNLNLAARYADVVMLMDNGRVVGRGAPLDVITPESIEATYDWPVDIVPHRDGAPQVSPKAMGTRKPLDGAIR
jgi:iron complex transport system ATP-binding protein